MAIKVYILVQKDNMMKDVTIRISKDRVTGKKNPYS